MARKERVLWLPQDGHGHETVDSVGRKRNGSLISVVWIVRWLKERGTRGLNWMVVYIGVRVVVGALMAVKRIQERILKKRRETLEEEEVGNTGVLRM